MLVGAGWKSFVAVGDSFTEGLDDRRLDGAGYRGWADLVAGVLSTRYRSAAHGQLPADERPDFRYANLAVRGKLFDEIVDEQVPSAMRMRPDLVSFAGGGNDVLRRSFNAVAILARFDDVVRMLRAGGSDVVLFRFADLTRRLPGRRLILPRVAILNQAVGEVAERHGARLVDLWHDEVFSHANLWSDDRLHLSSAGHLRVAARVLTTLGIEADPLWFDAPEPSPQHSWAARRVHDARWARHHLAPWVRRRIAGTSSGDAVTAKRPTLAPIDDAH